MNETPNLSYIERLSRGDKPFKKKLLEIVKRELPDEIKIYKQHLKAANYVKTAEDVHKLKHKINILGLEKSYLTATEYEINLKKGDLSRKSDFEEILDVMSNFLEKENIEL